MSLIIKMVTLDFSWLEEKSSRGQSTIEFLLTCSFAIILIFVFLTLAFNLTNGYLIHYATYMASRTYLVAENNGPNSQTTHSYAKVQAKKSFKKYGATNFLASNTLLLKFNEPGSGKNQLYIGPYASFSQKLSPVAGFFGGNTPIKYVSESFLGREPSRAYTLSRVCDAMTYAAPDIGSSQCNKNTTLFDNGG